MIELSSHERGTILRVKAQPNSRKNGILGERSGCLRIGVTVAPEKGKANAAIAGVLASSLGCRGSGVILLSGETAREKRFLVLGLDAEALRLRLEPLLLETD
jgi:uncharacterized protein